jgi:biopolymer transport protein ExbB
MLNSKENDKALAFAEKQKGVVAKIVTTCLRHSRWNRSSAEKAVKEILIDEVPQLEKHLPTLAVIAGAAPLLGLLGTVTGMISLFEVITNYGTGDPKILAGGISEALITTEAGLMIAIPVMLLHNYLKNQSRHIQAEMEKHAIRILNRLWPES